MHENNPRLLAELQEERFATIFRSSPIGICITTLEEGTFLDANPAFLKTENLTLESILGRTSLDLGYWRDPEERQKVVQRLKETGSIRNFEMSHRLKDGTINHSLRSLERITLDGRDCILTMLTGNVTGILGTWQDITERKRADDELRASRNRLAALSRQLITAQETERRHLALELHDEIGQALTGIKLNLKAMQQPSRAPALGPLVQETIAMVDQTLQEVRNLALDLRPPMLDEIGLVAALRWGFDRQARQAGFAAQFLAEPAECRASKDIETACFRVAQESLTNIARHANARNVRMELRQHDTGLELLVHDDGISFDVAAARDRAMTGASLGLLGMQERVELTGGQLEIESTPTNGTLVRARFPLNGRSNDELINNEIASEK